MAKKKTSARTKASKVAPKSGASKKAPAPRPAAKKKAAKKASTPTHAPPSKVRSSGDPVAGKSASEVLEMVAAQRPPPRPRPEILETSHLADAIADGKRRRQTPRPQLIERLAGVLVKVSGQAELLGDEAAEGRPSEAAFRAASMPEPDEFLAARRQRGEAKGGVWTEETEAALRDEYNHIMREGERLAMMQRAVIDLNESLDRLESTFAAAAPTIRRTHKADWVADKRVAIKRAFKETLHAGLARQPWTFNRAIARPGIDAAVKLAKWLYDFDFDAIAGCGGPPDAEWPTVGDLTRTARIGPDTFRKIREAAGIDVNEKGAKARNRRYSPAEVRLLRQALRAGTFLRKDEIDLAWICWSE